MSNSRIWAQGLLKRKGQMHPTIVEISGWVPAVIIPLATLIQLLTVLKHGSTEGVSWVTWTMFGIANIGLYIYTEKYLALQAIVGLLGTAVLDFVIAGFAVWGRGAGTGKREAGS